MENEIANQVQEAQRVPYSITPRTEFWRSEFQNQDVSSAMLRPQSVGKKNPSHVLSLQSYCVFLAFLGLQMALCNLCLRLWAQCFPCVSPVLTRLSARKDPSLLHPGGPQSSAPVCCCIAPTESNQESGLKIPFLSMAAGEFSLEAPHVAVDTKPGRYCIGEGRWEGCWWAER